MNEEEKKEIRSALEQCWSEKTVGFPCPDIASVSYCQCGVTALVIYEHFGGEILKTNVGKRDGGSIVHFYNKIDGRLIDFTADQFDMPEDYWCELKYENIPSSKEEVLETLQPTHVSEMRNKFNKIYALS